MKKRFSLLLLIVLSATIFHASAQITVTRLNPTTAEVRQQANDQVLTLDFYGPNIVRLFLDPNGGAVRNPEATPPAQILVNQPRRNPGDLTVEDKYLNVINW